MMISKSIWNSHAAHHMKREPLLLLLESTYKLTHSAGRVRSWSLVLRVASRYTYNYSKLILWIWAIKFPLFIHHPLQPRELLIHTSPSSSCVSSLLCSYSSMNLWVRWVFLDSIHSRCHLINMENGKSKSEVGLTHTRRRRKCPFMIRQIVSTFRGRISDSIIIILTRSNVTKFNIIDHKLSPVLSDHTLVLSA